MKETKYSFHDGSLDEVDREYERLLKDKYYRLRQDELVRKFINGKPLLDKATADKLGRREMVNFLTHYHNLNRVVTSYKAMVHSTDDLVNVVVDTGNPVQDRLWGTELSEAVNRGLIYQGDSFARFWDDVCDESVIAGGVPAVHGKSSGYIPDLERRMIFPNNADLDVENLSYCFRPAELSIRDLKAYLDDTGDENSKEAIQGLIEQIKEQIKTDGLSEGYSSSFVQEKSSVRDIDSLNGISKHTVDCYFFYEVKYRDGKAPYVSASLLARSADNTKLQESIGSSKVIELAYIDKAFDSLKDWITFIVVDSEIGGDGKINSLRGIAEMMYPAALKKEQLFNLLLEGDEIRALPKFILPDGMLPDEVQQLDLTRDTFFPNIQELRMNSSSNHLLTPMSLLDNVGGSFATGAGGSSTGEKLPEAKQRIASQGVMEMARGDEMRKNLQGICEQIVYCALSKKIKPNAKGYQNVMWFRDFLDKRDVPYQKLAERKYGRFLYIEVKVRKTLGSTGLDEQQRISKYFLDSMALRPPQQRANMLYEMDLMTTGDPDRARQYSGMSQDTDRIIKAQRFIAGQEWNDIQNISAFGMEQDYEGSATDVHQDHLPQHIQDLEGAIAIGQFRKIDQAHIAAIQILVKHINNAHLVTLSQDPQFSAEADSYRPRINQAINALAQLIEQQELEEGQQSQDLDPEIVKMQQKERELNLKEAALTHKVNVEDPELFINRQSRENRANRAQAFNEQARIADLRIRDNQTNNQ